MGFFSLLLPLGSPPPGDGDHSLHSAAAGHIWLWIIIFFGPLGAAVYIFMEVVPDLGLLRQSFDSYGRRKRIAHLEGHGAAEPVGGQLRGAGRSFTWMKRSTRGPASATTRRSRPGRTLPDAVYRRGVAEIHLGDLPCRDRRPRTGDRAGPKVDFHRAIALLAHAYANTGQPEQSGRPFHARNRGVDAVGDLPELRRAPHLARAHRRSARMGRARPRAKSPRCPATCSAASGRGSGRPRRCSSGYRDSPVLNRRSGE